MRIIFPCQIPLAAAAKDADHTECEWRGYVEYAVLRLQGLLGQVRIGRTLLVPQRPVLHPDHGHLSACGNGSPRSTTACSTLKMATVAPIPSASVSTIVAERNGAMRKARMFTRL
jgi:hypothetical protein